MARKLLPQREGYITEVAQRVGYISAGAFSVAFIRHVGLPPSRYAREKMESGGRRGTHDEAFCLDFPSSSLLVLRTTC
jgi:AraC-like DNA-binding protein